MADTLRYFTFVPASSTERTDTAAEHLLYLDFTNETDLVAVLDKLGILARGDGTPPSPIATPGPRNSRNFPSIVEPLDCTIAGVACHVDINTSTLAIRLAGDRQADAQQLEAKLDALGLATRVRPG